MRLLVSVTDVEEARLAVAGGVDVVDVKNPAEGSLGAPVPAVIAAVRAVVPPGRPLSVAIGDMPHLPGTAALAAAGAAGCGADYVKVGLWGSSTEDEAVAVLSAVRDAAGGGAAVIAAAYADAERAPGLPPESLVAAARRAGVAGCLLDTAVKDGRGLFDWLDPQTLTALVADAHAVGLEVALAGALRAEDLPAVRATGADIAGVRSAACRDGRRTAPLDPERITRLRALCDPQGATIRDATPTERADLEALQLRASLVWEEYRAPLLANPDAIELPAGAIEAGRVRVAVAEDGPTGFSVVMPVVDGACELDGLFVEPALMGRGIGRELIADVVARSDGATRLEVTANPRAIGFYEKLGFQPGETVQTRFGAGLRMHLDLRT